MERNSYKPKTTELYENFRTHYAARKKAQAMGASLKAIREIADLENDAWKEYVLAKKRETPRGEKFILPSRPL